MNNMRMLEQNEEDDAAEVTWEDQQRINTFSRLNTRVRALEDKLEDIKQQKEALDDLSTELELADEDEPVLYKIGETFLHMSQPKALKRLERDQRDVDERFTKTAEEVNEIENQMKELKVLLYAKFGKAINLEE
ncbi:Prefoldin, subunit 4 [Macrolepiota fuliginosa MF-IS2]|uniref:Prefoldin subunit 4 n=1 Tax=Macrolepiota fuliginosa MF-IS2 TaxID=1400762 RepID=A0A9P5XG82_9AGAR|nr:Prefoldin, subunit 4 [Macrolepiota fuliginosa MF-IS2]